MAERKQKMVMVDEEMVLGVVSHSLRNDSGAIQVCRIVGIPDGARVLAVSYDCSYRAFMYCIEHESFPDVPVGERIPCLETELDGMIVVLGQ